MNALPIVYVRGFGGGTSGIDSAVDDPFCGFNAGATHARIDATGNPTFLQFPGPLLRLIQDWGYQVVVGGNSPAVSQLQFLELAADESVPKATVWVHRFYDLDADTWTTKAQPFRIEDAAQSLLYLVNLVCRRTGAPSVHLVAHSMGGLICRSMLQKFCREPFVWRPDWADNPDVGADPAVEPVPMAADPASLVSKLFTYATPHGGIDFAIAPALIAWIRDNLNIDGSAIFGPDRMYAYLTPGAAPGDPVPATFAPDVLDGFPLDRVCCLVGTDAADYGVALGLSAAGVGPQSDGLVQIRNAAVRGAITAHVHRSHSGRYGIVNSEEGYQNLQRFLFGDLRLTAALDPVDLGVARAAGRTLQLDVQLAIRGVPVTMQERTAANFCPIQLADGPNELFSTFLFAPEDQAADDGGRKTSRFAVRLRVLAQQSVRGFLGLGDHLQDVAEWDDTLLVDIQSADGVPSVTYQWNSLLLGLNADTRLLPVRANGTATTGFSVDLPEVAQSVLSTPQSQAPTRLTLRIS